MSEPTATEPICLDCLPEPSAAVVAPPAPAADPFIDPTTFSPPSFTPGSPTEELPRIVIEFCDRCRWLHRATWTLTELFLTFPPTPTSGLKAITLLPRSAPETGGRFRVWLYRARTIEDEFEESEGKEAWEGAELMWDRKVEGRFPEMKELKQRIRNKIAPKQDLGHSDKDAFGVKGGAGKEETRAVEVERVGEPEKAEERETQVDDYAPTFRC